MHELGADTVAALITFTDPENLAGYQARHRLPFEVLTDPGRAAYRAFGLGRGSFRRVYGLRTLRRYTEIFRRRGWADLERSTEDTLQLGGDFVVDADGDLAWGFWGAGPDDRPPVDDLVAAVRAAGRPY